MGNSVGILREFFYEGETGEKYELFIPGGVGISFDIWGPVTRVVADNLSYLFARRDYCRLSVYLFLPLRLSCHNFILIPERVVFFE